MEDQVIKCKICGKEEPLQWIPETNKILTEKQVCFNCNFWLEQHELDLSERGPHNYAIIDGTHYVLCPPTKSYFKGFGGQLFTIKFNDGTTKQCNNLWCQGNIPERFKDLMPDNATFQNE